MDRSEVMRRVRSADTAPEMAVRRLCHALGYRYRLHRRDLPGKPDLVFPARRKAVFVHGCFWHGHDCKRGARVPRKNRAYWLRKISRNRDRDSANCVLLARDGWDTLVIWECEIEPGAMTERLCAFLGPPGAASGSDPGQAGRRSRSRHSP